MNGDPDIAGPFGEDSVLTELLAQRDRIFLSGPSDGEGGLHIPVLASEFFILHAEVVEVRLDLRYGGTVSFVGRPLASWVLDRDDCPITFAKETSDFVLGKVLGGGRVGIIHFAPNGRGGVFLLAVVGDGEMRVSLDAATVVS